MERCLQEFRVRGVKTNIPFLINLVTHPTFLDGQCTTRFIDETPELFQFAARRDRATQAPARTWARSIVNGHPLVKDRPRGDAARAGAGAARSIHQQAPPPGTRQQASSSWAPKKFAEWVSQQKPLLVDRHDVSRCPSVAAGHAVAHARHAARSPTPMPGSCPSLFSLEMWGGATFDTAMRFLKEVPWQRLAELRERIPNILFQMLLRASNAVGYANYPDNVVASSASAKRRRRGWTCSASSIRSTGCRTCGWRWRRCSSTAASARRPSATRATSSIPQRPKYDLKYYVELAKELEKMGAHILAIKDMAGLCKPYAAELLVKTLKQEIGIPIHFHTHDTSGMQAASMLEGGRSGARHRRRGDGRRCRADVAAEPERARRGAAVHDARHGRRRRQPAAAWPTTGRRSASSTAVRKRHAGRRRRPVSATRCPAGSTRTCMSRRGRWAWPTRWEEVCRAYAEVNQLLGDIVKVTPSRKAVGDLALFLVDEQPHGRRR